MSLVNGGGTLIPSTKPATQEAATANPDEKQLKKEYRYLDEIFISMDHEQYTITSDINKRIINLYFTPESFKHAYNPHVEHNLFCPVDYTKLLNPYEEELIFFGHFPAYGEYNLVFRPIPMYKNLVYLVLKHKDTVLDRTIFDKKEIERLIGWDIPISKE